MIMLDQEDASMLIEFLKFDLEYNDFSLGQSVVNNLSRLNPKVTNKFRDTVFDPFYDDKKVFYYLKKIFNKKAYLIFLVEFDVIQKFFLKNNKMK